jgi:rfaE bifunctional protein kinase chain/domain
MPALNTQFELDSFERILAEASAKTVLVLGDVILDEYVTGDVRRISPEAPVPVVDFRSRWYVAGGAANVAANIAALGCRALVAGVVGRDEEAEKLQGALKTTGVDGSALLPDGTRPTTVKMRILAQNQQIARLDRELRTPISVDLEDGLLKWLEQNLPEADACILSDYGKGVVTPWVAQKAIAFCWASGVPILVDPKRLDVQALYGATLVKPNKHEAERLVKKEIHDEASFLDAGRQLANSLDGTAVLITRGALGMSLFRNRWDPFHVATLARNVYDVTGAGDTVIGTLAVAMAVKATLEQAVALASQSAAIAVAKLGIATVSKQELKSCRSQELREDGYPSDTPTIVP